MSPTANPSPERQKTSSDGSPELERRRTPGTGGSSSHARRTPGTGNSSSDAQRTPRTGNSSSNPQRTPASRSPQSRRTDSNESLSEYGSPEAYSTPPPLRKSGSPKARAAAALTSGFGRNGQEGLSRNSGSPQSRAAPALMSRVRRSGYAGLSSDSGSPQSRGASGVPLGPRMNGQQGQPSNFRGQRCPIPNCQFRIQAEKQKMRMEMFERELEKKEEELLGWRVQMAKARNIINKLKIEAGESNPREQFHGNQQAQQNRTYATEQARQAKMEAAARKRQDELAAKRDKMEHKLAMEGLKTEDERIAEQQAKVAKAKMAAEFATTAGSLIVEAQKAKSPAKTSKMHKDMQGQTAARRQAEREGRTSSDRRPQATGRTSVDPPHVPTSPSSGPWRP
jgi:hypothetical protein